MKARFKKYRKRYLVRPIVYRTLVKFLCALCVTLVWDRFVNTSGLFSRAHMFACMCVLFAANAWFAFLRLDGVRLPRLPRPRSKKRDRARGGVTDYVDDPVVSFDELEPDQRDFCSFVSALVCVLIFLGLSLLLPSPG